MKKPIYILALSTLAIFTMSCDEETLAALTEAASSFLEKTPGCMNADNSSYNAEADTHVQDSCAVQIYGCTDATALNFLATATNMCAGITTSQCCTTSNGGCTDPNYVNYSETANSDDGSCSGAITYGCMTSSACNHNPNATADCSKVEGGTNTNCCTSGSTTITVCVQDLDNDDYQDTGTTSQTLAVNNCGCATLGVGWKDIVETNGEAIYGCLNPVCPEFDPTANRDDGNCCLGFSALDSVLMFGEDYADCVSDPTLCVETEEFSLLGGYFADFSGCQDQMMGPDDFHDELYIFLGWDGEYYEEYLSIHSLTGFRAPPIYDGTIENPIDCEEAAAGAPWFCGNQVADAGQYRPCNEEIFTNDCEMREECFWEAPECRYKPNEAIEICYKELSQSLYACNDIPTCQWDDGMEGGVQVFNPECYFDCIGMNEVGCGGAVDCAWIDPLSDSDPYNDGICLASSTVTTEGDCWALDADIIDEFGNVIAYTWCNWYEKFDADWNPTGMFQCECTNELNDDNFTNQGQAGCEGAVQCPDCTWHPGISQCDWKPSPCDGKSKIPCQADTQNNCEWDHQWGDCYQGFGQDCETIYDQGTCLGECEWWVPGGYVPLNEDSPWFGLADEGVCYFFDWCHEVYCGEGECDQEDCIQDEYCKWDNNPAHKTCIEDPFAQYCECNYEWNEASCTTDPDTDWDPLHHECMFKMGQDACYSGEDLMLGPEDGNIDCSAYVADNIEQYTEWNVIDGIGVCEVIFEDALDGTWSLDGNTICIDKIGVFEEEDCYLFDFEECQCNLHRCNWSPQPTSVDPDAGTCAEGNMPPPR